MALPVAVARVAVAVAVAVAAHAELSRASAGGPWTPFSAFTDGGFSCYLSPRGYGRGEGGDECHTKTLMERWVGRGRSGPIGTRLDKG